MKKILRISVLAFLLAFAWQGVFAQVTTSSINGTVTSSVREALPGATIVAVHEPSGTMYGTTSRLDGSFTLPNLRTGGPYKITVSYIGYRSEELTDIRLGLSEERTLNFRLSDDQLALDEVVVVGAVDKVFNPGRTGATTNIDNQTIGNLPSISRSITDFTKLNPQSNGTSFAGRDNRFNNFTVDGNIYNNNFGLGSAQFAAGNPISIDAVEEIQVNIAPYDVRQGGFTGAAVNAITKSGTNEFTGSAYYYFNNEQMLGPKIGEERFNVNESFTKIRGATIGGPIIKDKLFFFLSYEQEESSIPGDSRLATRPGLAPDGNLVTRVSAEHMDLVSAKMKELYGYETGPYENYPFANEATRLNFRVDYNISKNHRASVRYNRFESFRDVTINGNSVRNVTRYGTTNRWGNEALTFRNANYNDQNNVNSIVAELNSVFGNRFSNNLIIGYSNIESPKRGVPNEQVFPFIEVLEWEGAGDIPGIGNDPQNQATPKYYFALGNELFTVGNLLDNSVLNITNNFSMYMGKHTLTAGFNLEYMTFENAFNPNANTFYRFNSYQNFVDVVINKVPNARPDGFAMSYSYKGADDLPMDETAFGQFGIYFQDKIQVNEQLSIMAGLRVDMPFFPIDLPNNPRLDALVADGLAFADPSGGADIVPDVSSLPGVKPLFSPRVSFNYDVFGDNTLQLRGGTGFFSGRIPFVWISNQVSANGVTRGFTGWDRFRVADGEYVENEWGTGGRPAWQGFSDDPSTYKPDPETLEAQLSRDINLTDQDFKFPQVWRTNLAADYRMPFGVIATLEGIYSKDYNSPLAQNINLAAPAGNFSGADQRPYYTTYANNPDFNEVMYLTNTDLGYYTSVTAQLQKDFQNGLYLSLAYTRSVSKDYGLIGGSQAASLWPNEAAEDRNNPEMGFSRFDQPNRVVGYASFNTNMLSQKNTTNFSIYYNGGEAGRFSYVYSGGSNEFTRAARLMYIPNNSSEIVFLPATISGVAYTPEEQWDILNNYIEQDPYLSANRGKVAERNGAIQPWLHRFDFRMTQDILLTNDPNRYKFQITFDILNAGNLINSEWGVSDGFWNRAPLAFAGRDTDETSATFNQPLYRINRVQGGPEGEVPYETYRPFLNINQTWRAQIGIRFVF